MHPFGLARIGGHGGGGGAPTLEIFDIDEGSMSGTNLSNATPVTFTVAQNGDGTEIDNTTWNSLVAFTTGLTVSGDIHIRQSIDFILGGTIITGLAFENGGSRTRFQFYPANGTMWAFGTGTPNGLVAQNMDIIEAGNPTAVIDWYFRSDGTVTVHYALSGGAPYVFSFSGVPLGNAEILVKDGDPVTHTLETRALTLSTPLDISPSVMHSPLGFTARSVPTGFTYTVPGGYTFYEDSGNYYTSVSLAPPLNEGDIEITTLYVDIATGDDTNPGTAAAPLKSLHVAAERFQSGGRGIIKAKGGLYPYAHCFRNYLKGKALQIVSWDGQDIISSMHDDTLSWSASGGAYVATLATGSVVNVFDASTLTADGDYTRLSEASDVADCQVTAGTWFQTGTSVYVHTADSRAPDSDLRAYLQEVGGATDIYGLRHGTSGAVFYSENLRLEGGNRPFYMTGANSTANIAAYLKDCSVKYAALTGIQTVTSGLIVFENVIAAENGADGFNFQPAPSGGLASFAIEIGTIGRGNGYIVDATCNGSSSHGAPVIRVNAVHKNNKDRNVHDIDQNNIGQTWNMGCSASASKNDYANWATGISGGSNTTKMWLDGCTSSGGSTDIQVYASTTVYTDGFTGGGTNSINESGTITTYTP